MRRLIGLLAATAMVFILAVPVAAAPKDKFTICHATSSEGNPFVAIKVPEGSSFSPHLSDNEGNSPLAGHEQDFLLENTDLVTCDQVDDPVTPLAPAVSDATCDAPGALTLTEVDGVTYTIEPAYAPGDSGDFTVTATADEGFVIADGADTVFEVTVPAALDCPDGAEAVAPSVSAPTCEAAGELTLTEVDGVIYTIEPAYAAGDSGEFTVTATAEEGFELTGETSFTVNVPAKTVCEEGTEGGNPPADDEEVPDTAMAAPAVGQAPIAIAMIGLAALAVIGLRNVATVTKRR